MALRVSANVDPLDAFDAEIEQGAYIYGNDLIRRTTYHGRRNEWCNTMADDGSRYTCSRATHPAHWRHVAGNGDTILRVWGGGPAPLGEEFVDPEDGTPTDTAPVMTASQVRLGFCYRLRDRENQLYVIGGVGKYVRADKQIEVLDLKKREFRVVPLEEMVPSEYVMTMDELSYTVEYVAHVRQVVKGEAVAMYRRDKWCKDGLDSALKELGFTKHEPELHGELVIRLPWAAPHGAVRETVKTKLLAALTGLDLGLSEIPISDDPNNVIEIDSKGMDIELENVGRR